MSLRAAVRGLSYVASDVLGALWPAQAVRCALDRDYARAATAVGVSGQPTDDWLSEKEAEEEVAEPSRPSEPTCAKCGASLGEIAAVSELVPGMFCSDRCRKVAEIRQLLAESSPVSPTGGPSPATPTSGCDTEVDSVIPPTESTSIPRHSEAALREVLTRHFMSSRWGLDDSDPDLRDIALFTCACGNYTGLGVGLYVSHVIAELNEFQKK